MAKNKRNGVITPKPEKVVPKPTLPKVTNEGNDWLSWRFTFILTIIGFITSFLCARTLTTFSTTNRANDIDIYVPNELLSSQPCGASNYFTEKEVVGLHLICLDSSHGIPEVSYLVNIYQNSMNNPTQFSISINEKDPYQYICRTLEKELQLLTKNQSINPWAMFTTTGEKILNLNDMLSTSTTLVYEGGSFIWPGVKVGHKQMIYLNDGNNNNNNNNQNVGTESEGEFLQMETLSMNPLIFSIDNFLSFDECDYIQLHASPHMASSGVSLMDKDIGKKATEWRTSETYFMASKNHDILKNIDHRVSSLTKVPISHQELVQVLKYGEGGKYDAHHDYFDPKLYTKDKRTLNMIKNGKTNRMATVLWYLSDVDDGGHTVFPQSGGTKPPKDMTSCERGLKVSPSKGKVIMFYSLLGDGSIDKHSLHGSCPVIGSKDKWAANKWVWSSPMTAFGITN